MNCFGLNQLNITEKLVADYSTGIGKVNLF